MTPAHLAVECRAQTLWLLADKAIFWPAQSLLLVADCHFGKAATYRALGQPVPQGTTQENLDRLDRLLDLHAPRQVVFLGDFLHGPQVHRATGDTLGLLRAWRERHGDLVCTLVRGNHDLRAGDPPAELNFDLVDEPLLVGPFAFCHHPQAHASHHVLAGHQHPVHVLRGPGRDGLRLPCFVMDDGLTVLPAFGSFTGGHAVAATEGRRLAVIGGGGIWPV